jgi:23S rRNA (uridine2552-2'-O)-methyltransferase
MHKALTPKKPSKTLPKNTQKTSLTIPKKNLSTKSRSTLFRSTTPALSSEKYGDTWTKQAKALGYPSRAVFKLIQAQKKFKILNPGDVVVDLGCSPGSWSKLSSTIVSGNGFVLGMDLTTLSPQEQTQIGVRQGDINKRFEYPKSYHDGSSADSNGLLASERKLLKNRAPVAYMQQDVTQWNPGEGFKHQVDVILSDMAPNTTGIASADSASSIDLCYSVVDLCSQLFKPPSTKIEHFTGPRERQQALQRLKNDPNIENVLMEHLTQEFNKNMEKNYGSKGIINEMSDPTSADPAPNPGAILNNPNTTSGVGNILQHSNNKINLKMVKKTLKQHVYLQKPNSMGIIDTDTNSAIYKTNERTLSQIRQNEQISTTWRGTLMMKVFQGEGMTDLMNILKQIFVSTYTFKPESSRTESVEVFIICKGYCGPFDHTRITNKHIRRPKTDDYLRSYTSNNRKRPQVPHDPSQSKRYHDGFTTDSPLSQPVYYDPLSAPKRSSSRGKTLEQLYAEASGGKSSSYTSDEFQKQKQEEEEQKHHFDQLQQTIASGVTTNVHAAIKNTASLEQGAMSPLQREITESDDLMVFRREEFERLYDGERVMNEIPDTQSLIKSMSLFWDEGINFAKKMAVESQSAGRVDIFKENSKFADKFRQDEVTSILDDMETKLVTAESIMKEHQKGQKGQKEQFEQNVIQKNLETKLTKAKKGAQNDDFSDDIPQVDNVVIKKRGRQPKAVNAEIVEAEIVEPVQFATVEDVKPTKTTKKTKKIVEEIVPVVETTKKAPKTTKVAKSNTSLPVPITDTTKPSPQKRGRKPKADIVQVEAPVVAAQKAKGKTVIEETPLGQKSGNKIGTKSTKIVAQKGKIEITPEIKQKIAKLVQSVGQRRQSEKIEKIGKIGKIEKIEKIPKNSNKTTKTTNIEPVEPLEEIPVKKTTAKTKKAAKADLIEPVVEPVKKKGPRGPRQIKTMEAAPVLKTGKTGRYPSFNIPPLDSNTPEQNPTKH